MREKARSSSFVKRLLAIFAALAMVLTMGVGSAIPAMAAGTGTITINVPDGTPHDASNTYTIYKVFDGDSNGTSMSYTLLSGKSTTDTAWTSSNMGTYFDVDTAGNVTAKDAAKDTNNSNQLSAAAIQAIGAYVTAANIVSTATVNPTWSNTAGTAGTGAWTNNTATGLANGYYYITTTTGSAVSITSTTPNATVNDKTEVPTIDKTITSVKQASTDTTTNAGSVKNGGKSALAEVGSVVSFQAEITVGKNATNYIFEDTLPKDSSGNYILQLVGGSGKLYQGSVSTANVIDSSNYTYTESPSAGDDWTFQVSFHNNYTSGLAQGTKIYITYDAIVTSAALQDNPAENSAIIIWGEPHHTNKSTPSKTQTYNAKITVTKKFQDLTGENTLANSDTAEFVLTRKNGNTTEYYKLGSNTLNKDDVSWVTDIKDATKLSFNKTGESHEFTGLANGTYILTETKVPSGYNKAPDQTITINNADATDAYVASNLKKSATFENNKGSLLPSTGGIGTTIFYVIGGVLVAGAVVLLISRKRRA